MLKNERVKKDKQSLKKRGYKNIELIKYFDYYDNHDMAVSIYSAKKESGKYYEYFFPNELNPDKVWDLIKPEIEKTKDIISVDRDFTKNGLVFNLLYKGTDHGAMAILYKPDGELVVKDVSDKGTKNAD